MNQQKINMSLEIKKNNNNRKEISHQRLNKSKERKKSMKENSSLEIE